MHVIMLFMRTTIEIPDYQRGKLLEIAARRGMRGFSALVQEAIERYLAEASPRSERVEAALSVLGTLADEEAELMEESIRELRRRWR